MIVDWSRSQENWLSNKRWEAPQNRRVSSTMNPTGAATRWEQTWHYCLCFAKPATELPLLQEMHTKSFGPQLLFFPYFPYSFHTLFCLKRSFTKEKTMVLYFAWARQGRANISPLLSPCVTHSPGDETTPTPWALCPGPPGRDRSRGCLGLDMHFHHPQWGLSCQGQIQPPCAVPAEGADHHQPPSPERLSVTQQRLCDCVNDAVTHCKEASNSVLKICYHIQFYLYISVGYSMINIFYFFCSASQPFFIQDVWFGLNKHLYFPCLYYQLLLE